MLITMNSHSRNTALGRNGLVSAAVAVAVRIAADCPSSCEKFNSNDAVPYPTTTTPQPFFALLLGRPTTKARNVSGDKTFS